MGRRRDWGDANVGRDAESRREAGRRSLAEAIVCADGKEVSNKRQATTGVDAMSLYREKLTKGSSLSALLGANGVGRGRRNFSLSVQFNAIGS